MIKENVERVRQRIVQACDKIKADPAKITIVCVTKGRTITQIQEAVESGLKDIGENKVQEALLKYQEFSTIKWHMIGHLQSNKARDAVKIFSLIHSVDSVNLAKEIDKQAAKINKIQDILLEVKTSPEPSKFGINPQDLDGIIVEIKGLKNIKVKGLMTVAPLVDNASHARPYFSKLRELRDKLNPSWLLSMGMSDDFEVAVEEGANIIRIGRAIFEG